MRPHRSSFVFFSNNFFRFFFPLETKCRLSLSLSLFVFFCLNVRLWFVFVTGLPVCVCVLVCVLRGFCTGVGQRRSSRWVPPLSLSLSLSFFFFFVLPSSFILIHHLLHLRGCVDLFLRCETNPSARDAPPSGFTELFFSLDLAVAFPAIFRDFYWVFTGLFGRFHWIWWGFIDIWWVSLDWIGFYWYLMGFTGFYWVFTGLFGGLHWIGLGFIDI